MSHMRISEYDLVTEVIIPYLEINWDSIDNFGPEKERGNGRLTREKLFIKYLEAMSSGNIHEAIVLETILEKYDAICLAHEDAYIPEEEALVGITEEDVSVYAQIVKGEHSDNIRPYCWLPAKAS